jgi:hypothetical protein
MTGPGIEPGSRGERAASDLPSMFVKLLDGGGDAAR